jgi:hypothetical protein
MRVVKIKPRPSYPGYPLNRGLGGRHSRSGHFGEEKNLFPLPGFKPRYANSTGSVINYLSSFVIHSVHRSVSHSICQLFHVVFFNAVVD